MTHKIELPSHITDQLTEWATSHQLNQHDVVDAVYAAMEPKNDSGLSIVTTDEIRVYQTTFGGFSNISGELETVMALPPNDLEALEYQQAFHVSDGSIHTASCGACATTKATITASQRLTLGQWQWTALPYSLVGVRVSN